jgi:prolyl-tRNA synthetase
MRYSRQLLPTLKENPQDAETISHRLMLRAGLVRKLASGTYTYLPAGLRALAKAEKIVREEMDRAGALEILMPALQPADLWKETGRFEILGEDMIQFEDRHGKLNVLGPTHEEIITDLARHEIRSYRQLPTILYQIQTKFRDEMRPRAGVIRSREFIMKDAYSFHATPECLDETYSRMRDAYCRIFTRCGLKYYIVQADPGAMGGTGSQEFVLFSKAGEDRMVQFGESDRVMSAEMAERKLQGLAFPAEGGNNFKELDTPNASSIEAVGAALKAKPAQIVKTMIYAAPASGNQPPQIVAVLVKGTDEVSEYKVKKICRGIRMATRDEIEAVGSAFGYSGPIGLKVDRVLLDEDVIAMPKMIVGANKRDKHLVGVTPADLPRHLSCQITVGDFRLANDGDTGLVDGREETLKLKTAIELGHIFKLNLRYSEPMQARFMDETGAEKPLIMGCYGIGVNRIVAAAIEQSSTDQGIVWPSAEIAPYQVLLLTTSVHDAELMQASEKFYQDALSRGWDILWDERDTSAGIKFNDADLLGAPIRVTLGPKGIKAGEAEVKNLRTNETHKTPLAGLLEFVSQLLTLT